MKIKNLEDFLAHELKDLYSAETQLTKALPKMAKAAHDESLKKAFKNHLDETQEHVERIKRVCEMLDVRPGGHKCKGMEGLIEEGEELLKEEDLDEHVIDAALIAAAQRVEHYEIAGYGCAITHCERLGFEDAAAILQETLEEEKNADEKLTEIAESSANPEAAA
ncbi:MAG: ferritin-like domain-containing protein [Phycisphaerales bacterium]